MGEEKSVDENVNGDNRKREKRGVYSIP